MSRCLTSRMDGLYPGNEVRYNCHPAKPQSSFSQCCKARPRRKFVVFVALVDRKQTTTAKGCKVESKRAWPLSSSSRAGAIHSTRHSALGYQSPVSYEMKSQTRLEAATIARDQGPSAPRRTLLRFLQVRLSVIPAKAMQCVGKRPPGPI